MVPLARTVWETPENAEWLHLTEDETVQWTGRPSRYTIAVAVVGGVLLAVGGVALTAWLVWGGPQLPGPLAYLPLLLTVVGLAWAGVAVLNWLRLLYVVTDDEIYVKHGLLSRDVTQVRFDRVQNTEFEQSILERTLGYGDVRVYTAGTNTEDVLLRSVPEPHRVARVVTESLGVQGTGSGVGAGETDRRSQT